MATLAVQASPRVCGTGRLRVERKESTEPLTLRGRFHGSPRNPYYADPHEMAMLFQRGVSIGMTQAAQAHTIPPPVYAPYAYYQQYDPSHYGQLPAPVAPVNNNNTIPPGSLQSHGNGYLAQAMGQFQYSQAPAPLYQYTQPQTRPTYQWPPNANVDSDNASPTLGTQ